MAFFDHLGFRGNFFLYTVKNTKILTNTGITCFLFVGNCHTGLCTKMYQKYFLPQQKIRYWYFMFWSKVAFKAQVVGKRHYCISETAHFKKSSRTRFFTVKGIVSWDFDGIFMILSYSLDVRQLPLDILFYILCFHISILSFCSKVYHVWQKSSRGIVWKKMRHLCQMCHVLGINSATKSGL
jgi:hypothetical protein